MVRKLLAEITENRFRQYLIGFTRGIRGSFTGVVSWPYYLLHIGAILLTIPIVISGIDWSYFVFFRVNSFLQIVLFPAVLIGSLVPFFGPPILYLYGKHQQIPELESMSYALTQSAVIGLFWSSLYKSFTGRHGPDFDEFKLGMTDYSDDFSFGFLIGGVFDGWPSGHTTIAWAIAITFIQYRVSKGTRFQINSDDIIAKLINNRSIALIYAIYVAIGVSTNIHWLSDVIAGILIGFTVGISTAQHYQWDETVQAQIEQEAYDVNVYYTFLIILLIIIFSIVIPREIFNL